MTQLTLDNINLDKSIPIPLYYQLKKQILSLIEKSVIKEGELLPPESELCKLLNISRPTIRQAFTELVNEGYLNRYKGKGTYVSTPAVNERFFSKLKSFHDEMVELNQKVSANWQLSETEIMKSSTTRNGKTLKNKEYI